MKRCSKCGCELVEPWFGYGDTLCRACTEKRNQERIAERGKSLKDFTDLANWTSKDLSELFWMHLGQYVKEPTAEGYDILSLVYRWASHDDFGLASSFKHALDWAKVDLLVERKRWSR